MSGLQNKENENSRKLREPCLDGMFLNGTICDPNEKIDQNGNDD